MLQGEQETETCFHSGSAREALAASSPHARVLPAKQSSVLSVTFRFSIVGDDTSSLLSPTCRKFPFKLRQDSTTYRRLNKCDTFRRCGIRFRQIPTRFLFLKVTCNWLKSVCAATARTLQLGNQHSI